MMGPPLPLLCFRLLSDPNLRVRHGEAALGVARSVFSREACFSEAIRYLLGPPSIN